MCQFVAYQPENAPLSRRTVDATSSFAANAFVLPQTRLAAWNASKTAGALPGQGAGAESSSGILPTSIRPPHAPRGSGGQAWDEIATEVRAYADAHADGAMITMQSPFSECMSMEVNETSAVISAARAACLALGVIDRVTGVSFGSDASRMTAAGIPTIVFGPGSITQAHSADEHIEIAQVRQAARLLCEIARRFASAGP